MFTHHLVYLFFFLIVMLFTIFQDILHNKSIQLEKEFRTSLINDIVQVRSNAK